MAIALCGAVGLLGAGAGGTDSATEVSATLREGCDVAVPLRDAERSALLNKLRISKAGAAILSSFISQYSTLSNLFIQWDAVSFSQIARNPGDARTENRSVPSTARPPLGTGICVYLARKLPEIEHIADLAHELTHATRLEPEVLRGEVASADEFVRARLAADGGEADAFAAECQVKRELLGDWDGLCRPYAREEEFDTPRVVRDLYAGRLSASLTGEPYPVLLTRQYRAMAAKRRTASERGATRRISALENKGGIQ